MLTEYETERTFAHEVPHPQAERRAVTTSVWAPGLSLPTWGQETADRSAQERLAVQCCGCWLTVTGFETRPVQ